MKEKEHHICKPEEYEVRFLCRVCGHDYREDVDTYGVHGMVERWLARRGFAIVVAVRQPFVPRCPQSVVGKHRWEARSIVGIPFRRCRKCKRMQRLLYKAYWEDHHDLKDWDEWKDEPRISARPPRIGEKTGWN